ncbi:MAG: hypothetical protein ABFS39_07120 [Pseudomonadota bacterium]
MNFTDFGIVQAGTNGDSFVFGASGSLVTVTGGAGSDTIDLSGAGGSNTVDLGGNTIAGVVGGFTGFEIFIGDNSSDVLQLADGGQSVTISGVNDGSVTGGPNYTDFANLLGGIGNDTFVLQSGGSVTGTLNGGGGVNTLIGSTLADTITINGSTSGEINTNSFTGFTAFSGGDGDDAFIIDFSSIGLLDVTLDGALGTDSLLIQNGSHVDVVYNYIDSDIAGNNGEISIDSHVIAFTGLDPIINTGSVTNIVFNLPDVTVNNLTLENYAAIVGNTELVGTIIQSNSFSNPTNSLTINLGDMGDTLILAGADAGFDAALTVNGGIGTDTLTHTGDLGTLNGISFMVDDINLNYANLATSGDNITLQGAVVLADPVVSINSAGGYIEFQSTIDGMGNNLVLNAGSTGDVTLSGDLSNGGSVTVVDGAVQSYQAMTLNSLEIQNGSTVTFEGNINATGSISVASGEINLNGTSYRSTTGGAIGFTGAVNLNAAGAAVIQTAGNLSDDIIFNGSINSAQPLTLDAGVNGSVDLQGAVVVPELSISAGSALLTDANNEISTLSLVTGAASVNNTIALTLADSTLTGQLDLTNDSDLILSQINATGQNVNLNAGGTITDSAQITANSLTTSSVGGTDLDFGHQITDFNANNTGSGDVVLNNLAGVNVSGVSNAVGDTYITTNGAITETGNIQTIGLITSSVNGTVLDGSNTVASFNATNTTDGDIQLNNTSDPLELVSVTNQGVGDIVINNTGEIITTGAIVADSGDITIIAGSPLTIGSNGVSASGSISLEAGGELPDNIPNTGDLVTLNGSVNSTAGDIRIVGADEVIQNADISSGSGTIKVFADNGEIMMAQGVTSTTSGSAIVYTASGDVTIAVLDTGATATSDSVISVTSINGDVKVTGEDANIKGQGAIANIFALGDSGSIGESTTPIRFQQPDISSIVLGFSDSAYISGQGNEIIVSPVEIFIGTPTYETSDGLTTASRSVFGGTLTDISAVTRELSNQVQSAGQSEFEDVSAALLKDAIKIHNVIGSGTKLPDHQLEEDEEEGGLTYYYRGLKLINGLALEGMEGRLVSPHLFNTPVDFMQIESGKY